MTHGVTSPPPRRRSRQEFTRNAACAQTRSAAGRLPPRSRPDEQGPLPPSRPRPWGGAGARGRPEGSPGRIRFLGTGKAALAAPPPGRLGAAPGGWPATPRPRQGRAGAEHARRAAASGHGRGVTRPHLAGPGLGHDTGALCSREAGMPGASATEPRSPRRSGHHGGVGQEAPTKRQGPRLHGPRPHRSRHGGDPHGRRSGHGRSPGLSSAVPTPGRGPWRPACPGCRAPGRSGAEQDTLRAPRVLQTSVSS